MGRDALKSEGCDTVLLGDCVWLGRPILNPYGPLELLLPSRKIKCPSLGASNGMDSSTLSETITRFLVCCGL